MECKPDIINTTSKYKDMEKVCYVWEISGSLFQEKIG